MAKQSRITPEPGSGLENELIQGANELPGEALEVTPQEAAAANLELPKPVEPKTGLPLMVPESAVMTESDLKAALDVPQFQNDPGTISAQELHEQRVKRYGADYVVVNKGKHQQVFTRLAWNQMRGDKGGWREAVQVPMEVRNLNK